MKILRTYMPVRSTLALACMLSLFCCFALAQEKECTKIVISADSDYGPLHWYDGTKLTGVSIDIATTALKVMHVPYELRYMGPFQRVLEGAKSGEVDMITSLKDTPERREYLAFSKVALFSNPVAVFVARSRPFNYTRWSDLIGKKGGIAIGNRFGDGFDDYMNKNLQIEWEQKTYMNFKKIELGRIDYLITGYYSGLGILKQSGQLDKFIALKPFITESDNLIAISKRSPCLKYLQALDNQLAIMRENGELKTILERDIATF